MCPNDPVRSALRFPHSANPENDYLHLDHHVTYVDVIIVCFHDTLYQLKYFELQGIFQSNFACSSDNDPGSL